MRRRRRQFIPIGLLAASPGSGLLHRSTSSIHGVVPPTLLPIGYPFVVMH